ncbi:MAG: hypothetical protein ACO4CU_08550, partial [Ilumatobacteraceae bacterium]
KRGEQDPTGRFDPKMIEEGRIPPRLEVKSHGPASYGPLVADWAARHLKGPDGNPLILFPWQTRVLSGLLEHKHGDFHHRWGLVSTARQQGKTTGLLIPLIGWWLTDGRQMRGGPQAVMSVSHKLAQAEDLARGLFPILEETFGFTTWSTYGRKEAQGPDGTIWRISAANDGAGHGTSNDLIICDEIWNIDDRIIEGGLLPTQRARPNPLALFVSTAGDDSSTFFRRWRERGIAQIGTKTPGRLYFAEWSVPPDASIDDQTWWPAANPALAISPLDWQTLRDDSNNLARDEFQRTCLNRWVASVESWLPVGAWDDLARPGVDIPRGGVLAIDSASDGVEYAGVRAFRTDAGVVQVAADFNVTDTERLWQRIAELVDTDTEVDVMITPGLHSIAPPELRRRMQVWGQKEIGMLTEIVRNMILEQRIEHGGDALLDEHVRRAVAGRNGATITLSSVKSPGPIHLCRCMVAAAGRAARPTSKIRKPQIGVNR